MITHGPDIRPFFRNTVYVCPASAQSIFTGYPISSRIVCFLSSIYSDHKKKHYPGLPKISFMYPATLMPGPSLIIICKFARDIINLSAWRWQKIKLGGWSLIRPTYRIGFRYFRAGLKIRVSVDPDPDPTFEKMPEPDPNLQNRIQIWLNNIHN